MRPWMTLILVLVACAGDTDDRRAAGQTPGQILNGDELTGVYRASPLVPASQALIEEVTILPCRMEIRLWTPWSVSAFSDVRARSLTELRGAYTAVGHEGQSRKGLIEHRLDDSGGSEPQVDVWMFTNERRGPPGHATLTLYNLDRLDPERLDPFGKSSLLFRVPDASAPSSPGEYWCLDGRLGGGVRDVDGRPVVTASTYDRADDLLRGRWQSSTPPSSFTPHRIRELRIGSHAMEIELLDGTCKNGPYAASTAPAREGAQGRRGILDFGTFDGSPGELLGVHAVGDGTIEVVRAEVGLRSSAELLRRIGDFEDDQVSDACGGVPLR